MSVKDILEIITDCIKDYWFTFVMVLVVIILIVAGYAMCSNNMQHEPGETLNTQSEYANFTTIESGTNNQGDHYEVIVENHSGAMYYREYHYSYRAYYTTDTVPLYNSDGTVRIYKPE